MLSEILQSLRSFRMTANELVILSEAKNLKKCKTFSRTCLEKTLDFYRQDWKVLPIGDRRDIPVPLILAKVENHY